MKSLTRSLLLLALGTTLSAGSVGCKRKAAPKPYEPPPPTAYSVDDYRKLCEPNAKPFAGGRGYERSSDASKPSKMVLFAKYADDKAPSYSARSPEALKPLLTNRPDEVELVACLDLKRHGTPGFCNYYGGKVTIYDMTHDLRIIEAKTGRVVHQEKFELDRKTQGCSSTESFKKGSGGFYRGADYDKKLMSVLLPLQPEGLELPAAKTWELNAVCSGSPVPQAAAFDPKRTGRRRVHPVYFPDEKQSRASQDLPEGLPPQRDQEGNAADYELVACVTGKPLKKRRDCKFMNGNVLELYDGEVEVAVYEAKTAKLVEKKSFKASSPGGCPWSHKFWGSRDTHLKKLDPGVQRYVDQLEGKDG
ncbi:MAG: hypothetical protein R3B13_12755 [Polyangiaceae bacterium]